MAKLKWVLFCERAIVDSASNNLSIHNTLEQIAIVPPSEGQVAGAAGKMLAFAMQASVVSTWERSVRGKPEKNEVRLRLVDPSGKERIVIPQELNLAETNRGRLVANLPGLPAAGEGDYVWVVELKSGSKWKRVGEIDYQLSYASSKGIEKITKRAQVLAGRMARTAKIVKAKAS